MATRGVASAGSRRLLYEGHRRLSPLQRAVLAVGASAMALADPRRADLVATVGETTAGPALAALRDRMASCPEGRDVLTRRPSVSAASLREAALSYAEDTGVGAAGVRQGFDALLVYPVGSLGRAYHDFMHHRRFSPDDRPRVRFVDDPELAFVMQRYREVHDFWHVLTGAPTTLEGECALKLFEAFHTGLPMSFLAALGGPMRLTPDVRKRTILQHTPWAFQTALRCANLMCVPYENRLADNLSSLRRELLINVAPMAA